MLDLPDMDAVMPLVPFQNALVQPWSATSPPLLADSPDGFAGSAQLAQSAVPTSWLSLLPWSFSQLGRLSHLGLSQMVGAQVPSPLGRPTGVVDAATMSPLGLAALLEPVIAFAQPAIEGAAVAVTVPVQWTAEPSLGHWAAIADVHVLPAREDQLSPLVAGLAACTVSPPVVTDASQVSKLRHQLFLQTDHIADFASPEQAEAMAQQLRRWHQAGLAGEAIVPLLGSGRPAIQINDDVVMPVTPDMAEALGHSPEWVAVAVANNLRRALGAAELDAGTVQMAFDQMMPSKQTLRGTASWYGPYFHGRMTANGETFDQYELTAAHKTLPFNTRLHVRNVQNGRTVVVRINDRGPYIGERSLDLSKLAARCLGSEHAGVVAYEALILQEAAGLDGADGETLALVPAALDQN